VVRTSRIVAITVLGVVALTACDDGDAWQAGSGAGGDLGRLSATSTTRDLPVAEIQAVVTQG
jgi:hypothetical protein